MSDIPVREQFIKFVGDLKEETVLELVQQRIKDGESPLDIIDDCQQGLLLVGERYEKGEYYISGLIMAEIMQ